MVFEVRETKNKWIEDSYKKFMKELNKFFVLKGKYVRPSIILVPDRKSMDQLFGSKTQDWSIGWVSDGRTVFLLSPNDYEQESSHKFSKEAYEALIKHELTHCFTNILTKGEFRPYWLGEGIAIYLSGQDKLKKRPKELKSFLSYFNDCSSGVYVESGFAVESLVKNHGKEKLLTLLKRLNESSSKETFKKLFKSIYGFELSYKNFPLS